MGAFGQVFGQQVLKTNFESLNVLLDVEKTILAGDIEATPQFLAKWLITRPTETEPKFIKFGGQIQCAAKRDTGTGFVIIGLLESADDITYFDGDLVASRNVDTFALITDAQTLVQSNIGPTATHFAIGIYNNDGITTGRIKEISFQIQAWLPLGLKITRLI